MEQKAGGMRYCAMKLVKPTAFNEVEDLTRKGIPLSEALHLVAEKYRHLTDGH